MIIAMFQPLIYYNLWLYWLIWHVSQLMGTSIYLVSTVAHVISVVEEWACMPYNIIVLAATRALPRNAMILYCNSNTICMHAYHFLVNPRTMVVITFACGEVPATDTQTRHAQNIFAMLRAAVLILPLRRNGCRSGLSRMLREYIFVIKLVGTWCASIGAAAIVTFAAQYWGTLRLVPWGLSRALVWLTQRTHGFVALLRYNIYVIL